MKSLPIRWQRLVGPEGTTCERCGGTYDQMIRAMESLRASLIPLGIEPVVESVAMDEATFKADPSQSNRIWIAGRPMEEWLEARVGSSPCCSVCGDAERRGNHPRDDPAGALPGGGVSCRIDAAGGRGRRARYLNDSPGGRNAALRHPRSVAKLI
jgi:hypothetical protein